MIIKLIGLVAFLFLASCSRTDLALEYADTFLAYELKSQFDFEGSQKKDIENLSASFIQDLKKELLPEVVLEMQEIEKEFLALSAASTEQAEWQKWVLQRNQKFKKLGQKSFLLLDRQRDAFVNTMQERNWVEFKNEFSEQNKKILKEKNESRMQSTLERFVGDLNKEQESLVKQYASKNLYSPEDRVENRKQTLMQIDQKVQPFSSEKLNSALQNFFKNNQDFGSPEVKTKIELLATARAEVISGILKTLSKKQSENLLKNWRNLQKDLQEVIKKAQK